jgi:hypothetical protein
MIAVDVVVVVAVDVIVVVISVVVFTTPCCGDF